MTAVWPIILLLAFVSVFAAGWVFLRYWATWPAVQHVSCARCGYNIAFAKNRYCQECGVDLLDVGILKPNGRRLIRPRRYIAVILFASVVPLLIISFFVGGMTELIVESWKTHPSHRQDGTQSIIATNSASGVIRRIEGTIHYKIRSNDVTYTHLELNCELDDGQSLETLMFSLPDRGFILQWERGVSNADESWSGTIVPDPESSNNTRRILRAQDVPRSKLLAWLQQAGIDVEDSQTINEIDSFREYLITNMVAGGRRMTAVEHFENV